MVYVFCPDDDSPTGGIKVLYRHVDVLNGLGVPATIVHEQEGFRCTWFENSTTVSYRASCEWDPESVVLLPEIHGPDAVELARGLPVVIFNQSGSLTFHSYPLTGAHTRTPYLDSSVVATLAISEHVKRYVEYAFPDMPTMRVRWSIDDNVFSPVAEKRRQICFMPRRHAEEARQVFNILRYRGALEGFSVVPIDDMTEEQVATVMGESLFFFSFGYPEGLPLPPAEAMACGCAVVGYDGFGGAEYFHDEICYRVPVGDVLEFARVAEVALELALRSPEAILGVGLDAARHVRTEYSAEREVEEIRQAWSQVFALCGGAQDVAGD